MTTRGLGMRGRRSLAATAAVLACLLTGLLGGSAALAYNAPDPGGSESAPVPVPPPSGRYFGFHELLWGSSSPNGWSASQLATVAQGAGANVMRMDVDWATLEPDPGVWNEGAWQYFDSLYNALVAHGMAPVITVTTTPPWARDTGAPRLCLRDRGCEYPPSADHLTDWGEFVAKVAQRYPKAVAIEVWNEPNIVDFWKPTPQPERYAQLVRVAYNAVKGVNPGIQVLAGALAPTQTVRKDGFGNVTQMPMDDFLQAAYTAPASIKNHLDGISFHDVEPNLDYGEDTLFAKAFDEMRDVTSAHGDPGVPLWITEDGLSTSDGITPKQQADGLLRQYRRVMTMPDVRGLIIHTLADRAELPSTDPNYGFGLISSFQPFTPKPAYCAFAGRVDTLIPFGGCPKINDNPPPPPPPDSRHRFARHECRGWYRISSKWPDLTRDVRQILIALCVPIDLSARSTGILPGVKHRARSACKKEHPPGSIDGSVRHRRHVMRACRYGKIRHSLGLGFKSAPSDSGQASN